MHNSIIEKTLYTILCACFKLESNNEVQDEDEGQLLLFNYWNEGFVVNQIGQVNGNDGNEDDVMLNKEDQSKLGVGIEEDEEVNDQEGCYQDDEEEDDEDDYSIDYPFGVDCVAETQVFPYSSPKLTFLFPIPVSDELKPSQLDNLYFDGVYECIQSNFERVNADYSIRVEAENGEDWIELRYYEEEDYNDDYGLCD
ncbi:MAG: hypothetical protein EZS28_001655 [Streblomastix strix]|uniref:Uncharacterized protein n=1 Tax=Streblomastix strix TaxID=222440 RepID=A0A5J4X880_9EUKA|nr:MAG: hypothetical protein EZS28_001655 [Streblomastix strix]